MSRRRGGGGFGGSRRRSSSRRGSSSGGLFKMFGGSKKKKSSAGKPAARRAPAPARQPQGQKNMPPAIPQGQQGGGMMSGLAGTVVQGAAFGAGSGLAHRAVDSVLGPRTVEHVHSDVDGNMEVASAAVPDEQGSYSEAQACRFEMADFSQCMQENPGNLGKCQFFYDVLTQCQSNASGWQ